MVVKIGWTNIFIAVGNSLEMIFKKMSSRGVSDLKSSIDKASLEDIEEKLPDYFRRQGKGMGSTTKEELMQFMKFIPNSRIKNSEGLIFFLFFRFRQKMGVLLQIDNVLLPF